MITLYHGTSARHLPSILKSGLQPRGFHKNSNWAGDIESKAGFVYLTSCYPVYFAMAATKGNEDMAVIRVEVDENKLFPDEDYIALCLKTHDVTFKNVPLLKINAAIKLSKFRRFWVESLKNNGKVSIRSVPAKQITGHVIIEHDDMQTFLSTGGDSVPSPLAHMIYGEKYRQILEVMFTSSPKEAAKAAYKIMYGDLQIPEGVII